MNLLPNGPLTKIKYCEEELDLQSIVEFLPHELSKTDSLSFSD